MTMNRFSDRRVCSAHLLLPFVFAIITVDSAGAQPAESISPRDRLARAFRFADGFPGRQFNTILDGSREKGRASFDGLVPVTRGEPHPTKYTRYVASSGDLVRLEETASDYRLKLIVTPSRQATLQFDLPDDTDEKTFVDEPLRHPFERHAAAAGSIWCGCLYPNIPCISGLLDEVDWQASESGDEISGVYDSWKLVFSFHDAHNDVPERVSLRRVDPKIDETHLAAITLKLSQWGTFNDVRGPGVIEHWSLTYYDSGDWETMYLEEALTDVGPPVTLSSRYDEFFAEVPDGTRVQVNDYPGIEFIWRDGEIVRKVDGKKLASLLDKSFFGSPFRRYVLIAFGGFGLAAVGWFFWRR